MDFRVLYVLMSMIILMVLSAGRRLPERQTAAATHYCLALDPNPPSTLFTTHTAYEASDSDITEPQNGDNSPGCEPIFFWHLIRHGTRYPSKGDIITMRKLLEPLKERIVENYNAGQSELCELDKRRIEAWSLEPTEELAVQLTTQGQDDAYHIARRFKLRFPGLLGTMDRRRHSFWYDESQRTEDSAKWYAKGLLGYVPELDGLNELNDFYQRCPSYNKLKKSPIYMAERERFEQGWEMNATVRRVSRRLGFGEDDLLGVENYSRVVESVVWLYHESRAALYFLSDEVMQMYQLCGYERAWNWRYGKSSPWCAAFSNDDFEVMEYWGDLREYYRTGYGHELHVKLGCAAMTELTNKILAKIKGKETRDALHYFSHDTLLNMVYANLGFFRDRRRLLADNFRDQQNRNWRVSKFSPFASNLAAVLYMCGKQSGSRDVQYHVEIYQGEKLIQMEGCSRERCPLNEFLHKYGATARQCNLDYLCSPSISAVSSTPLDSILD